MPSAAARVRPSNGRSRPRQVDVMAPARSSKGAVARPLATQRDDGRRSLDGGPGRAPPIDADEQEQPDHVDEMPVPGGCLEPDMVGRGELALHGTEQAD